MVVLTGPVSGPHSWGRTPLEYLLRGNYTMKVLPSSSTAPGHQCPQRSRSQTEVRPLGSLHGPDRSHRAGGKLRVSTHTQTGEPRRAGRSEHSTAQQTGGMRRADAGLTNSGCCLEPQNFTQRHGGRVGRERREQGSRAARAPPGSTSTGVPSTAPNGPLHCQGT